MAPSATYRLQLHAGFPLARARELVDYLARLGVSHVYASPLLRARRGSQHGYDVVDPTALDPELGAEADLEALASELRAQAMGLVVDIVPNHMATSSENPFWEDVLAHGRSSPFAVWFDVDWDAARGKILLPVLGDLRARVVTRGELSLAYTDGQLRLRYYDQSFPLDPATVPLVLARGVERLGRLDRARVQAIVDALRNLPSRASMAIAEGAARRAAAADALGRLRALYDGTRAARAHVDTAVARFATGAGGATRLAALMDAQAYRLVYWRRAAGEVSYRRFFNVGDLVGVRVEEPAVFEATHARVRDWVARGWIDALRVDHIDGLADPRGYLARLRAEAPVPVYVEKILTGDERLPADWPVAGTTGYEFLNALEAIFIHPHGAATIDAWYRRLAPAPGFEEVARAGKRRMLATWLAPDARRLGRDLARILRHRTRGLRKRDLTDAIVEVMVHFPVYRTYIDADGVSSTDRGIVERALAGAKSARRARRRAVDLVRDALLGSDDDPRRLAFVRRFQQTTAPVMAKGVEDTALYRWIPLVARNEVGGDPGAPLDGAVARFHAANQDRAARWPRSLLATSTHDTKRSADVRARLDVLSEVPERWLAAVERWRAWSRPHRRLVQGRFGPDRNTEYLLYQTIVGVWPLGGLADPAFGGLRERVRDYMLKAVREAKVQTSWIAPSAGFEDAVRAFVDAVFAARAFLADVDAFVGAIARPGLWNALARTLVHLTAPGVPDVFQGDELWSFALTDPDNRRPVDFARRRAALDALPDAARATELVADPEDGRVKLHVVRTALAIRRLQPDVFAGDYEPLTAIGPAAEHVFAFARSASNGAAITIVPRVTAGLVSDPRRPPIGAGVWTSTEIRLPPRLASLGYADALTGTTVAGESLALGDVLATFPVALLVGRG